jgi:Pyruvate/2-oxoacid:ferredoxin oxidoreductase delta subunit
MTAAEHEVHDALTEGVTILDGVMPVEVIKDASGRATGLKIAECKMEDGRPTPVEGTERVIEADLIVSAIGQGGDLTGLEAFDNGRGLMNADKFYQVPDKAGHFVAGDIIRPHLLTTAIGQASIAADSIDEYLRQQEHKRRPKVDVHHFNLLKKMEEAHLAPEQFDVAALGDLRGTSDGNWAIHNYEDRSGAEVIPHDELFLGHFGYHARNLRKEEVPTSEEVLGHFKERVIGLSEAEAIDEAKRCMSCGMCFECDNCVIFCPQDAVFRVKKGENTTGRYVDTDYAKCIGCHICSDVCPTGYIKMGLGE